MKIPSLQAVAVALLFAFKPDAPAHDSGGGGGGGSSGGEHGGGGAEHSGGGSAAERGGGGNWHGSGGAFSHGSGGSSHGGGGGWHGGGSNGHDGDHGRFGRHFYGGGFLGYPYDDGDYGYGYGDPFYFPPGPSYAQAYRVQAAGSLAAAVQQSLARAGYYRGPVDGEIGPMTRKSIGRYQSGHGLPVTRRIDEPLLRSLRLL